MDHSLRPMIWFVYNLPEVAGATLRAIQRRCVVVWVSLGRCPCCWGLSQGLWLSYRHGSNAFKGRLCECLKEYFLFFLQILSFISLRFDTCSFIHFVFFVLDFALYFDIITMVLIIIILLLYYYYYYYHYCQCLAKWFSSGDAIIIGCFVVWNVVKLK